ncbi:proteinase-activated receptor 2-like [Seriola aureovittata]|uniref:proteinase-activated receptor 2-like n=1 Tax=Seriola aureovittata TaxID=2871759 RepID=UPI0024BE749D|nr:proteinase-activated receptor 2-like [Seriola aureovittata]
MQLHSLDDAARVLFWIDVGAGLPFTLLLLCCLFCLPRKDQLPITYVANLLISNLIQICFLCIWIFSFDGNGKIPIIPIISTFGFFCGMTTSLCFRMCVALERYMVIAFPEQNCIRRAGTSVFVCVAIWVLCFIIIFFGLYMVRFFFLPYLTLVPFPLFIACLALTLRALPAATSVPAEEKRRTVGVLVLLLVNYTLLILPSIIIMIVMFPNPFDFPGVVLPLIQLSAFPDLILVVLMREGPVDKLLARLCCCRTDDVAADDCGESQV